MAITFSAPTGSGARVRVQKFGTFLSNMIMPNIPALIAWGLLTALVIDVGWLPNADLATMVGPIIHYALPILIAATGGRMVHGDRGAVVGGFAVMGAIAGVMAEADTLMNADGMLVFFAGVPNGTLAPLNLSAVYLDNAQYTGTSGLTIHDQQQVVDLANRGELSPGSIVGAVGGMRAAKDGLQALVDGSYSGKVLIFPQIHDLPLMGLDELKETLPAVAEKLGPGDTWNGEAEKALFDSQLSG